MKVGKIRINAMAKPVRTAASFFEKSLCVKKALLNAIKPTRNWPKMGTTNLAGIPENHVMKADTPWNPK